MVKVKILVTGGAGFIGSNITHELVRQGLRPKVIDNLLTGNLKNLIGLQNKIDFVRGDIKNLKFLQREFSGIDYVLHQAALPSVPRSVADPVASMENNITGTLNVLLASRDRGVKRVVFASSSSVYGNVSKEYKSEDLPVNPLSPYALTKYTGEKLCQQFYQLYGLETICLRYFNVFGPYQNPDSQYAAVIPSFIKVILQGRRPIIFGDGSQSRDFTYVANNVWANLLALKTKKGIGEVINIACGQSITLNDLMEKINQILGISVQPIYRASRPGDVKDSKAGIAKAKKLLAFKPIISFDQGLKETIKWYQKTMS